MFKTHLATDLQVNRTRAGYSCQHHLAYANWQSSSDITCGIVKQCKFVIDQAFEKSRKVVPPSSNTGVEVILSGIIDYLATTYHKLSLEGIKNLYSKEGSEWIELQHGCMGYKSSLVSSGVRILYDGKPDMGIHVIASGMALRNMEALGVVKDWPEFLGMVKLLGGMHTRVDVAIDDKTGLLDLQLIEQKVIASEWTSHSRHFSIYTSGKRSDLLGRHGKTIAIGSRQSETYTRIYDKAIEQQVGGHWIRVEVESKGETASKVIDGIIDNGMVFVAGVLRRALEFVDVRDNKERSRWTKSEWWQVFLSHVEKAKLIMQPVYRSIETIVTWLGKQASKSLAMMMLAYGGDIEQLFDIIGHGKSRMKAKDYALVNEYQTEQDVSRIPAIACV